MRDTEFKELLKIAVNMLSEKTIPLLLKSDQIYQKDAENEAKAEECYLQLNLTQEQREICQYLLECRDKQDTEYATHAYIAGLYDAFRIMTVIFPDRWDMEQIQKALSLIEN